MKLWAPEIDPDLSYYQRGKFILIWQLSLLFILVFGTLAGIFYTIHPVLFTLCFIVFNLSVFSVLYLRKFKDPNIIFWLFTISATVIVIFSMNNVVHTLHYSDMIWVMCIILFAFIGLKYKYALIFVAIHALSLVYFVVFGLNEHYANIRPRSSLELFANGLEISFGFIVMCTLMYQNLKFQSFAQKELREVNKVLENQNKENITLLKEVHHRVKNNLQIVISMLRMQSANISNEDTAAHFNSAINRIMTISLIHNKLYNTNELSNVCFKQYIEDLIHDIKILLDDNDQMHILLDNDITSMDFSSMITLGLIINELVTNSIKHANNGGDSLQISVSFNHSKKGEIRMSYSDNGKWKENSKKGFGLELIESLNGQLDGKLSRVGSAVTIDFEAQ